MNADIASVIGSFLSLKCLLAARLVCAGWAAIFINPPPVIYVRGEQHVEVSRHNHKLAIIDGIILVNGQEILHAGYGPVYNVGAYTGTRVVLLDSFTFFGLEYQLKLMLGGGHREFPMLRARQLYVRERFDSATNLPAESAGHIAHIKDIYCVRTVYVFYGVSVTARKAEEMLDNGYAVYVYPYREYFCSIITAPKLNLPA